MLIEKKKVYKLNPDCDSARLLEIVRVNNEAFARGERTPLCLGHTPGESSTEFLTIDVGEGKNFTTDGEFVLCDLEIDEAFAEAVKRHRGVSVELWSDNRIFPISLLAHNRPALELEPIKYSREGDHSTATISEPEEDTEMDASAVKNIVAEVLLGSDLSAQVKALTDAVSKLTVQTSAMSEQNEKLSWLFEEEAEEEAMAEEAAESPEEAVAEDAEAEAEEHPELPPEEIEKIAEDHVAEGKGEEKPEVEEKNDMAMPSGTNTFVPSTGTGGGEPPKKKKNYEELALESETFRLSAENQKTLADGLASQVQAVAEEANTAKAALATLERKYKMLDRKNELIVLAQKYQFDPEAEMKLVENMDDAQFDTHKKTVVVRYAMPPVNTPPVVVGELDKPNGPDLEVIPQKEVTRVAKYAMEKGYKGSEGWKKAATELGIIKDKA
jgi:hypothetical protein